ncbi:hypothetical protein M427DRAFT_55247 [Gonapodya prolifera JEL478]|uniref:Fe2OG dioxygenase domain-containing protein n=1 Tax=Gonapodya prolifera (strain JEL478) TaxID=1344416 RepID=A0A139AIH3_GONPJ|nr:hypothetical protein M427DRAFT_55247 [Gonapodya prolifera JEL478]|eukprot:KXS16587.1 hypothetical protein M427DRAFT_55247 [Gonapodya prolifera JEL478]
MPPPPAPDIPPDINATSRLARRHKPNPPPPAPSYTPFRVAEKHFKRRDRPVDLSGVIDMRRLEEWVGRGMLEEVVLGSASVGREDLPKGPSNPSSDPAPAPDLRLSSPHFGWLDASAGASPGPPPRAFTVPGFPGMVLIQSPFHPRGEREVVKKCVREYTRAPNVTNLDTHWDIRKTAHTVCFPGAGLWDLREKEARGELPPDFTIPLRKVEPAGSGQDAGRGSGSGSGDGGSDSQPQAGTDEAHSSGPVSVDDTSDTPSGPGVVEAYLLLPNPPSTPANYLRPLPPSALLDSRIRWTSIGLYYDWTTKEYVGLSTSGSAGGGTGGGARILDGAPPVPVEISDISRAVVGFPGIREIVMGGKDAEMYEPQGGIVNYYGLKDTLMAHQDRSEADGESPLVSISFGSTGIFLVGGATKDSPPIAIFLRSGDIVVLSGPTRRSFHGLPRVLPSTLPSYFFRDPADAPDRDGEWDLIADFMTNEAEQVRNGGVGRRINVNVRQVC